MKLVDVDSIQIEIKRPRMDGKYLLTEALAKELEKALKELPAVDAELVRHGKWITDSIERNSSGVRPYYLFCSECHHSQYSRRHMPKYCSNCGAKMDGGKK